MTGSKRKTDKSCALVRFSIFVMRFSNFISLYFHFFGFDFLFLL